MKKIFTASLTALALSTCGVFAQGAKDITIGAGPYNWAEAEQFKSMDVKGEKITVFGPWTGNEKANFERVVKIFEDLTGADVEYTGSDSFEQQINIDVEAGSPPNLAVFPQPGLAANVAAKGGLVPLGDEAKQAVLDNYAAGQSWVDLGTYADKDGKDQFYGLFYNVNVKSLVWYVPDAFEDAGYEIPKTMEELIALSDKIVADGGTPWCIGLGSGAATGWPATDWVEDIMLRTQTPADYDKWVSNELKFNDPKVVAAIETFGTFAKNDKYVDGGASAVGTTDFRDSPKGMFNTPPKCYLHRQASFIPAFFPDGTKLGEDADFFYMPPFAAKKELGNPVLGAGTLFAMTKESKGTRAFIKFLESSLSHELYMAQNGFLTPHKGVNTDIYPSATMKAQGDILLNATTFRFDGSDLMPGAIGAGTFWSGMVDFVSGKSAQEVADGVQKSWDDLK